MNCYKLFKILKELFVNQANRKHKIHYGSEYTAKLSMGLSEIVHLCDERGVGPNHSIDLVAT